jgi:hypothetical protein
MNDDKNYMHVENSDTNINSTVNPNCPKFENISHGTLRRYQAFFNLRNEEGNVGRDKNEVLRIIKNHFQTMELESDKVVENFIKIEKDQNNEKNNSLRKSIRFQEKNMAKFLDNFNSYTK